MSSELTINQQFKDLIPPLTKEEYNGLEESIKNEGCRDPIIVWNGNGMSNVIIDGHNRYEICCKNDINFKLSYKDFDSESDAKIWIIKNQFSRRNLDAYQRVKLSLRLEEVISEKAKKNLKLAIGGDRKSLNFKNQGQQKSANLDIINNHDTYLSSTDHDQFCVANNHNLTEKLNEIKKEIVEIKQENKEAKQFLKKIDPIETRKEIAKLAGVSHDTVSKVKKIEEKATPEVKKKLENQEISINQAYQQIKNEENRNKPREVKPLPVGLYDIIYADPPWKYDFSKDTKDSIEVHYPTMDLEDIEDMEVPSSDNSVLFLWTTSPKLEEGLQVLNAWGFKYKSSMVWDKSGIEIGKNWISMGYWFRGQHEILLVGVKGKFSPPKEDARFPSIYREFKSVHSKKPEFIYEMIEKMFPNENHKYLELFARNKRENWTSWGNESGVIEEVVENA